MPNLKPHTVKVERTRHKSQPYTVDILLVGKRIAKTTGKRFSTPSNAVRAGMGRIGADYFEKPWNNPFDEGRIYPKGWFVFDDRLENYREVQVIKPYLKKK